MAGRLIRGSTLHWIVHMSGEMGGGGLSPAAPLNLYWQLQQVDRAHLQNPSDPAADGQEACGASEADLAKRGKQKPLGRGLSTTGPPDRAARPVLQALNLSCTPTSAQRAVEGFFLLFPPFS